MNVFAHEDLGNASLAEQGGGEGGRAEREDRREEGTQDVPVCHHGEAVFVGEDDVDDGATAAAFFLLTPPAR